MSLYGLSLEHPLDPLSFSGSSKRLFTEMREQNVVAELAQVRLASSQELFFKLRNFAPGKERWRARYKSDVLRFRALGHVAGALLDESKSGRGVFQIGARFLPTPKVKVPLYTYHDGNAVLRYRFMGNEGLSSSRREQQIAFEKQVHSATDGIFCFSQWLADSFHHDYGVPFKKLHVVGAGINLDALPERKARAIETPHFIFVGKEFERKGGQLLLEAFRQVRKALPTATLSIIGPDVRYCDIEGVKFLGFLRKSVPAELAQIQETFRTAVALVLPSIYEPFGIALLEAMAYEVAAIAVDRCAMPEIVSHGETGLVAAADDVAALARAMIEIGSDPEMARTFGANGRLRVENEFVWSAVVKRVSSVISV